MSFIDLVIENIGAGSAIDVKLSESLPINRFDGKEPQKERAFIPTAGFPAISSGQRYIFNGGQYAGLKSTLGPGLSVKVSYKFRNPVGFLQRGKEVFVLSVGHLNNMLTRTSSDQAIVDALKSSNITTIHEIRNELHAINEQLRRVVKQREKQGDDLYT